MTHEAVARALDPRGPHLIAEWTRGRMDALAHDATRSIWREVAAYQQYADLSLFSEVEAHCRQVIGVYVTSVRDCRYPSPRDFPWTQRHAMRRVDLGIGLSDFLRAFRVGQIKLWDDIMSGVDEQSLSADTALQVVGQVLRTIEVGSSVAAETYLEAQQYQLADSARLARDLLEDLLTGNPPTVPERRAALQEVGIDEGTPLLVMVATLPEIDTQDRELRRHIRRALTGTGLGLIVSRHDEVVAVLPVGRGGSGPVVESVRAAVASLAGGGVFARAGVSAAHDGFAAVPDAYEEARLALQSLAGPGVRSMAEMSTLDLLVHSQEGLGRMVPPEVRGFIEEDLATGAVLVDTLSAYVAHDLNARLTAMHLQHHVNTVYYRLGRIAERTGRDVRSAEDLIDLLLAVRLLRAER
jgi:hypothetical protein